MTRLLHLTNRPTNQAESARSGAYLPFCGHTNRTRRRWVCGAVLALPRPGGVRHPSPVYPAAFQIALEFTLAGGLKVRSAGAVPSKQSPTATTAPCQLRAAQSRSGSWSHSSALAFRVRLNHGPAGAADGGKPLRQPDKGVRYHIVLFSA